MSLYGNIPRGKKQRCQNDKLLMHTRSKWSTSLHDFPQANPPCPMAAHLFDSAAEFQIKRSNIANIAGTSPTVNYFPVIFGGRQDDQDMRSAQSAAEMGTSRAVGLQNVQSDDTR